MLRLRPSSSWVAVCPKCSKIAVSNESGMRCPNCNSTVSLYTPHLRFYNGEWESEDAELSWRQIRCDNNCGWHITKIDCPSCGATIQGRFLKSKACFVATACFDDSQHSIVESLRAYRDQYLIHSTLGVKFVNWYYERGPMYARLIKHRPVLKWAIRQILKLMLLFLPNDFKNRDRCPYFSFF